MVSIFKNIYSALKTGKTLDFINQENEIQEEKKRKEHSKKKKQIEEFKITAKQLLDEKVATVKKYLEKGDYQSVNKYLRILSNYYTYNTAFDTLNSDNDKWRKVINGNLCTIIDTWFSHELVKNYVFNVQKDDFVHYYSNFTNLSIEKPAFHLHKHPILLFPWNKGRIVENIENISHHSCSLTRNRNLDNYYFYPMGLIECYGGNHSQFSALLENSDKHVSEITQIVDVTLLYDEVYFDGQEFKRKSDNKWLYKAENDFERLYGVYFEIGRILMYYPDYFPNFVLDIVKKTSIHC